MNSSNKKIYVYSIIIFIVIITCLHYLTSIQEIKLHELYKRLYYIPIIIAAFNFRTKGGVILPTIITIFYLPYIIIADHSDNFLVTNLFEISMFFVVGITTGILADMLFEHIEEINELQEQVRRSDKLSAIGQLAAGIAHEIRNPLAIINTISQTLLEEDLDSDTKESLEIIQEEVNRANKVITELLNFAKADKYNLTPIDINSVLQDVVLLTDKYAKNNGVEIVLKDTNKNNYIYADVEKIKQAFINVIFNAIDSIEEDGYVFIETKYDQEKVFISFADTGIGIDEKDKNKIFEPFYTTKDKGVGLGLAITFRIIEEHKGIFLIDSLKGKGTKVIISLPILESEV